MGSILMSSEGQLYVWKAMDISSKRAIITLEVINKIKEMVLKMNFIYFF
jgi:hypothetical protein